MDLGFLAEAYRADGPYATVFLQSRHVGEDAAQQIGLRWHALAHQLRRDGVDQPTLRALEAAVMPQRPGPISARGRVLVAANGTVLLDLPLPYPAPDIPQLTGDEARWAPLPHLLPYLVHERPRTPHLVVVANRVGADIHLLVDGTEEITTVDGDEQPVHKVQAGGWSHRRFQQRAENTWEHNAALVASTVSKLATQHRAKLVLLAGDVRARSAIADRLSPTVRRVTRETETGGRALGAAEEPLRKEAARLADATAEQEHHRVVERFLAERNNPDHAVEGLERTAEAFRQAAVDTLLLDAAVHLDSSRPRQDVWVGTQGRELALTKIELEKMGVEEYAADRPDAALIRACVATSAQLELVGNGDPTLTDGVAALLRHPLHR